MIIFRPAANADLNAIYQLAINSGVGLTTLPKDMTLLDARLKQSLASFNPTITSPGKEYYLFVLEDTATGHVAGTAAIEAMIGIDAPFYSYRHISTIKTCPSLGIERQHDYLKLVYDNEGRSEICTLYLDPAYRRHGNGLLLSLARFLFMAQFPERFTPIIIAEMRGVSDENGHSPFWEAAGFPFFQMPYTQADQLTFSHNKQFIADLIPELPLYINVLPKAAQRVIGRAHASTLPALSILQREGFNYNQTVDIFDAGPTLEARRENIRTLAQSQLMTLRITADAFAKQRVLIANTHLDFRATVSQAELNIPTQTCGLNQASADALNLMEGDIVRISTL